MTNTTAFQLSRVEAQGWNAARRLLMAGASRPGSDRIAKLNPYAEGLERARWALGFKKAFDAAGRNQ
jgi:hypothetical protein